MELTEYQIAALETFVRWRDELVEERVRSETAIVAVECVGVDVRRRSPQLPQERPATVRPHPSVGNSSSMPKHQEESRPRWGARHYRQAIRFIRTAVLAVCPPMAYGQVTSTAGGAHTYEEYGT